MKMNIAPLTKFHGSGLKFNIVHPLSKACIMLGLFLYRPICLQLWFVKIELI